MASTETDPSTNTNTFEPSASDQKAINQDQTIQAKIQSILSSKLNTYELSNEKGIFSTSNNQHRLKEFNQSIGESIRSVLLEFYPNGHKFMICTQVIENKGQAGRAGLVAHWDETNDKVFKEIWSNEFVIGTVSAFVVKVAY